MKPILAPVAAAMALGAAGCADEADAPRAALDCPARQGAFTRTSAAADGKACVYAGPQGVGMTLRMVPVNGDLDVALAGIEDDLRPGWREADARAAMVKVEVSADGRTTLLTTDGKTQRLNLPSLPGMPVVGRDVDGNITVGPAVVATGADGPIVSRKRRGVRLPGQPVAAAPAGVWAALSYQGPGLPDGGRFAAYEAAGPQNGPLVVAVLKGPSAEIDAPAVLSDARRLVGANVGL